MFSRLTRKKPSHVLIAAAILAVGVAAVAGASSSGYLKLGTSNSSNGKTSLASKNDGYGFSVSSKHGEGAIFVSRTGGPAVRAVNKSTDTGAVGATIEAKKGPAAQFKVATGTAPFTVNSSTQVDNLTAASATNSTNLNGKGAAHYGAAAANIAANGTVATTPAAYGLDSTEGGTTTGGDGVVQTATGTYTVFLGGGNANTYIIQLTSQDADNLCAVTSVSSSNNQATIACHAATAGHAPSDTAFFLSATQP